MWWAQACPPHHTPSLTKAIFKRFPKSKNMEGDIVRDLQKDLELCQTVKQLENKVMDPNDYQKMSSYVAESLMGWPEAIQMALTAEKEKEVLKEALRLSCEKFVFHMKDCPAEFNEDFMDDFKCHDICDQYPDKPFSCWLNYFVIQARSNN